MQCENEPMADEDVQRMTNAALAIVSFDGNGAPEYTWPSSSTTSGAITVTIDALPAPGSIIEVSA